MQKMETLENNMQKAIDLFKRATEADKNNDYVEAIRLYELGVESLLYVAKYQAQGEQAVTAIKEKCLQYLDRAEKIQKYLESKKKMESIANTMQKALNVLRRATEEDKNKNYEEAVLLYNNGVESLLYVADHEAESERAKTAIKEKCLQYLNRAEKIQKYLDGEKKPKSKSRLCNIL